MLFLGMQEWGPQKELLTDLFLGLTTRYVHVSYHGHLGPYRPKLRASLEEG